MSEAMIEKLSTVDLATVIILIALLGTAIKLLTPYFEKLKTAIIKKYKKDKSAEDLSKMVHEDHDRMRQYEQNRIHDREQSFQIQKELLEAIKSINDRLDAMQENTDRQFRENREREDKRTRAELKDRISQCYRYHHANQRWTSMEKESLEDLIAEYESAGGDNSFVHSKVQVEMYEWEIIDNVSNIG